MKTKYIFILLATSITSFGQNKFVGKYDRLLKFEDTLQNPRPQYLENKSFDIKNDFTYTYTEQENPNASEKTRKETVKGSWKADGDTIVFYNKNYTIPKGIVYNYLDKQNFKGVKVVVKDSKGKSLKINWCNADMPSSEKGFMQIHVPYKVSSINTVIVPYPASTTLYIAPKGFCDDYESCELTIPLDTLKSGTLIEINCYSTNIENRFNGKKYILTKNILYETSTNRLMPDAWTDNFIRKK